MMTSLYRTRMKFRKFLWPFYSTERTRTCRRCMSAAQAASALRPFYFAVHPDLFGRYPDVRHTNENSLKAFNGYLDELYSPRSNQHVKSVELKFYLRARSTAEEQYSTPFETVFLSLRHKDPYSMIRHVLESCRLSTDHLPHQSITSEVSGQGDSSFFEEDENLKQFWIRKNPPRDEDANKLNERLEKLISNAEKLSRTHATFETEISKAVQKFKSHYGVKDVLWHSGWTLNHCRGCLQLLSRVIDNYRVPLQNLSGWIIKFGRGVYVSVDGCVVLGVDDVPEDWCRLLLNISPKQIYFNDLKQLESTLSQYLNNAIVCGLPDESVVRYKSWLKSMNNKFKNFEYTERPSSDLKSIGVKFENVIVVIVNDSCSLSWDAEGRVLVPAGISVSNLIQFLQENYKKAEIRRHEYLNLLSEISRLKSDCLDNMKLIDLNWDSFLNLEAVKECLQRLCREPNISILHGRKVQISRSYAVLSDGTLCVPVDY